MKKLLAGSVAVVALLAMTASVNAATTARIASYEMNEGPRQHVLHDSVNGLDGTIGADVVRNGSYLHFKKYPFHEPLDLDKTARVYSPDLNPGSEDFVVTWRMRTGPGNRFRNIMQKGQGGGPLFKFRVTHGVDQDWNAIQCFWRGDNGGAFTTTPNGVDYGDRQWHKVRCAREGGETTMTVDGKLVDTDTDPGTIENAWPLAIGGNVTSCESSSTDGRHCNYFSGDLAWVRFSR